MHIAFYSPALPASGASNGIVTYSRIMSEALRALGHSVTIVTGEQIQHADGRILPLSQATGIGGRVRWSLEALHGQDGTHVSARVRVIDAFRAARCAGAQLFEIEESFGWARRLAGRGIPIVERLHGPHVFVKDEFQTPAQARQSAFRERAEQAAFAAVDAVTSPTERLLRELVRLYGSQPPVDRAIPNPIAVVPPAARWRLEDADQDQILFVGRFDRCKGADIAILAFAAALKRRPSLKLIIAGPDIGLTEAAGRVVHFEDFVTGAVPPDARSRIRFLGLQQPGQITELRLRSAFAVVASRFENFPYSIAEAMAVGMPVLSSGTFGGAEMIRDGLDGCVVPVGDVDAMAGAMLTMASNPDRLTHMGERAYARAADWLSPDRIARETVDLYRAVLARH